MPRSTSKATGRATRKSSPIPKSPGPLFPSSPERRSPAKRARSKSKSRSPPRRDLRPRVVFADGTEGEGDATHPNSDGSVVNNSDHAGGSDVDTASAARSSGGGYASELSSELLNSLQHADDPLMQQLGSFLSATVAETATLRRRLAASEEKARINQMVRDYEERGVSTFHHDREQMRHVFRQTILPHIVDRSTRVYYENLDWDQAEPEELGRAFSQLIKIAKSAKNRIFRDYLRDSDFPTLPRELSSTDKLYYSKQQLEKDKELMQMHTDFAPVLQVLFHAALNAFRSPDGVNVSAESLLEECQQSIEDLSTMLFEYYGKVIAQPRRDLFSKATGLRVSQSSDTGFMTRVEADAAMESAKQTELISMHIERSAPTVKPSFNKKAKGKGAGKGGGKGSNRILLRHLPQQQQQQQ